MTKHTTGYAIDPYYDTPAWRTLRRKVLQRDRDTCQYCGSLARQADHVIPRKCGGSDTLRNLVACCHHCNKTAGNHRFRSFSEKKKWVLENRRLVPVERKPIKEKPKSNPLLLRKPPKRGVLRTKLAAKNNPQHIKEERLLAE